MKKIKLFLAAIAAMVTMGVQAQTWTASEVGAGKALLYNVGKGQYFTRGNGYSTQASVGVSGVYSAMTIELIADGSNYKIRTAVNGTDYGVENLGETVYTDQSRNKVSTWTFTQVSTDNGPVYNIISADNHSGGAGSYMTASADNTIVGPGTDGSSDYAKWKIYLVEDQKTKVLADMPNATESSPIDASVLIGNTQFSTALAPVVTQAWTMNASNQNLSGGNLTNNCAESWRSSFTLSQTITVPNGYYQLRAQAFVREYDETGTDYPVVYLDAATKPFKKMVTETASLGTVSDYFKDGTDGGYWTDWTDVVTVTSKSITIGVRGTRTNTWCAWDNFQLQYLGPIDLSEYITGLANAVAAAQAYESQLPAAVYANIASVITEYNKTYEDGDGYSAAIQAINNAVSTNATAAIIADYARYNNVKTAALSISSNVDTSTADTEVAAATTTAAIDAAIATLRDAFLAELPNVTIPAAGYIDVTAVMVDNASVRFNTDYWTITNVSDPGWNSSAGVCNYEECEFYSRNFKFYQTLALTPGTWEFGVTGFHRAGNHNTHFYAGVDKILIPGVESSVVNSMAEAKTYFDNGNGKVALKFLIETAGDVEIGIDNQDTETDKWTIFRDFTLKYYGAVDYSIYETQWEETVAAANEALEAQAYKYVSGSERTAVTDAIADAPDGSSKANYLEKIQALENATITFKAAAPSYNAWVLAKTETTNLWGSTLGVAAPTTAAEAADGVHALNIAQYNKVATDYTFSATGLIGDFGTWTGTATVAGEPATPNYLDNEHWSGATHAYYEQAASGWGNANGWTIQYQKTCTLPAGSYVIKVAARSSVDVTSSVSCTATETTISLPKVGNSGRGITKTGVASWSDSDEFIASTAGVANAGAGWQWRFLPFTLDEEGEVTMTFYAETNKQYNWMSIADGELLSTTKLAQDVAYNDADDNTNTIANTLIADVTITRTIKEGFNTVCLPFTLTANQVTAAFGADSKVYNFSEESTNPNDATINFQSGDGSITANVPVLVKATAASSSQTFEGVQIVAADAAVVEGANFDFVGTYAPTSVAAGDYFIGNGALYKSEGATSMKAFRAYIQDKNPDQQGEVKLFIDDIETSISEINGIEAEQGVIYNIAGQRVNKAQKGIYIVNGKKVLVK